MIPIQGLSKGWVQNVVVACITFCCPGFFNALAGLGNAGSSDPGIVTATNACLYGTFAVFGYFGGFFFNLIGPKWLLVGGGLTYGLYATGIYVSGFNGWEWMGPFVGAVLGIGAGLFWTAQGAITLSYATADLIGTYVGVFWVIFNLGGVTGGLISFGLNFSNASGAANPVTYFVFIGVMCMGAVLAVLLIVPPNSVTRSDGSPVEFEKASDCKKELKDVAMVMFGKEMLLLSLMFFQSNFFYAYEFNGVNAPIFTVRSRSLNSAMYWASQMLGSWVFGQFLMDNVKLGNDKKRGIIGFAVSQIFVSITWVMAIILTYVYEGGYEGKLMYAFGFCHSCEDGSAFNPDCDDSADPPVPCCETKCVDIEDSARYVFPIIVFVCMGIGDALVQSFSYWIMGAIGGGDVTITSRYAGYYKGIQSLGGCISWAIDRPNVAFRWQLWINIALFIIAIPPTFLACLMVPEQRGSNNKSEIMDDHEKGPGHMDEKGSFGKGNDEGGGHGGVQSPPPPPPAGTGGAYAPPPAA
eukprot:GHVN01106902.1.p1 GENE.GHVN01106902.1~~GHVN01106902.1.p1  ORF type:complete len:524 (-),score=77.77 GHVN01106902.1:865-2436(-)